MNSRAWWPVTLLVLASAFAAQAGNVSSYCPDSQNDPCEDDECKCTQFKTSIHDPINALDGNTVLRRKDVEIVGSSATLKFLRTYVSRDGIWNNNWDDVYGIPRPFGASRSDASSLKWTHNFFSYARDFASAKTSVRDANGRWIEFTPCSPLTAGCWFSQGAYFAAERNRLRFDGPGIGYTLLTDKGIQYVYHAPFGSTRFFLSQVISTLGVSVATVVYGQPQDVNGQYLSGCPNSDPLWVPYISAVTNEDLSRLVFAYKSIVVGTATECVLTRVSIGHQNMPAVLTTAAEYDYTLGAAPVLASAVTQHSGESYYDVWNGQFWAFQAYRASGPAVVDHEYGSCNSVTRSAIPGSTWTLSYGPPGLGCGTSETVATAVGNITGYPRFVSDSTSGKGTGESGSSNLPRKYWATGAYPYFHGGRLFGYEDVYLPTQCTPASACSPGRVEYGYESSATPGGYLKYERSKNGNFTWYAHKTATRTPTVTYPLPSELSSVQRGLSSPLAPGITPAYPDCYGAQAGDCDWYSYSYGSLDEQRLDYMERYRPMANGYRLKTSNLYEAGTNRLSGILREGYTKDVGGATILKYVGTYFFTTATASGNCVGQSIDLQARTLEMHGPCFGSALGCNGNVFPITQFTYWPPTEPGHRANRLKKIARFPGGCSSPPVETLFNQYDATGNITEEVDANQVSTFRVYDAERRLTEQTFAGRTTKYQYDNGRLSSTQFPEGNYEIACYRTGTPTVACAGGTWTPNVQWRVKTSGTPGGPSDSGATWSEKVSYAYWPDGTVSSETYRGACGVGCGPSSGEVRRVLKFAADAHRRQTWRAVGEPTAFSEATKFDGNGNLTAIGIPYNMPPGLCDGATTQCASLFYDSRDSLSRLQVATDLGGTTVDTRLAYDVDNNPCAVTAGASPGWGITSSPCGVDSNNIGRTASYAHDDFDNVIEIRLPNTDNGSGERGIVRQEFDARGNVVKRQTEEQRAGAVYVEFSFDQMGRPTGAVQFWDGAPWTLYTLEYDSSGAAPPGSCPQPANTAGRLRKMTDPLGVTWYQYDSRGFVAKEIRLRALGGGALSSCTGTVDDAPHTSYSYSDNGNLLSIQYPHGRTVSYTYGSGALKDRVAKVSATTWASGAWVWKDLIDVVLWEPFGILRGYQMVFPSLPSADVATLEYQQGAAGSPPVSSCPATPRIETDDLSGRLRGLWLSAGAQTPGNGNGDIYKRTYTWTADQISKTETCYLGSSNVITEDLGTNVQFGVPGYDNISRLRSVKVPGFDQTGGPERERRYAYDSRGNRTDLRVDEWNNGYTYEMDGIAHHPDRLARYSSSPTSANFHTFEYDRDGRVTRKAWSGDTGGTPAFFIDANYVINDAIGPGSDTVYRAASVNGANYLYWYDWRSRRIRKDNPLGTKDEFFYDQGHLLLEDRGNASTSPGGSFPIDEYVWLGGRMVGTFRTQFGSDWVRKPDFTNKGLCSRAMGGAAAGDGVSCSFYFAVTDNIGKPLLALDSKRRIAGAGEYEPFGHVNRVEFWWETQHPYGNGASGPFWVNIAQHAHGMQVAFRAHFPMVDTEQDYYGNVVEGPSIWDGTTGVQLQTLGGFHKGDRLSDWFPMTVNANGFGVLRVGWSTVEGNCQPYDWQCTMNVWPYWGFMMRNYEYRRYQAGATPYLPSIRFPGHYFDVETDLHENWNRYYDPATGRYLQPEPMLQFASYEKNRASQGVSIPTYSYALNNPTAYFDSDGLEVKPDESCGKAVRDLVKKIEESARTTKNCRCMRLLAETGLIHRITTKEAQWSLSCHAEAIPGQGKACGYGSGGAVDVNQRKDCGCFSKNLLHELLHTDSKSTNPDWGAMTHNPDDKPKQDPSFDIFNAVMGCITCDGRVVQ